MPYNQRFRGDDVCNVYDDAIKNNNKNNKQKKGEKQKTLWMCVLCVCVWDGSALKSQYSKA